MPYEIYSDKYNADRHLPFLSISAPTIRFNLAACRLLRDAGVKYVNLFWDHDVHKLALRKSVATNPRAYKLSIITEKHAIITCKSFLARIGVADCSKIPIHFDFEGQFLIEVVLPLKEPRDLPVESPEYSPSI